VGVVSFTAEAAFSCTPPAPFDGDRVDTAEALAFIQGAIAANA
jgi:hypothetical protein